MKLQKLKHAIFVIALFWLYSCQNCQTCKFTYSLSGKSYRAESEERCGSAKELRQMKKEWEEAAEEYGVEAECVIH